jgi:streptogramin lyase
VVAPLVAALLIAHAPAPFPGATTSAICGARTIPYQQSALAQAGGGLWLACRDAGALVRLSAAGRVAKRIELGAFRPWAVVAGAGAVWAISRDSPQLLKLSPAGTVVRRISLLGPPAALWFGAGSVWIGFESFGFARVQPGTGRVSTFAEGDGVSAFASDGTSVYAVSHRDNAITRVALSTGKARRIVSGVVDPSKGSTEAVAFTRGSLWITGRGLDLLRVSPATGKVRMVTDVGPAGFNVATSGGRLVVAGYSARGARRGDPILGSVKTVDPASGKVLATVKAAGTAYLSGLAILGRTIYAADTVQGRLVRLAVPG